MRITLTFLAAVLLFLGTTACDSKTDTGPAAEALAHGLAIPLD